MVEQRHALTSTQGAAGGGDTSCGPALDDDRAHHCTDQSAHAREKCDNDKQTAARGPIVHPVISGLLRVGQPTPPPRRFQPEAVTDDSLPRRSGGESLSERRLSESEPHPLLGKQLPDASPAAYTTPRGQVQPTLVMIPDPARACPPASDA